MLTTTPQENTSLKDRSDELLQREPGLRQRDVAQRLGCSEGELIATKLGSPNCFRIGDKWLDLLRDLEAAGSVMALTRNEHAVIEKVGCYRNVSSEAGGAMGQVLDEGIDLRLFLKSWGAGFARLTETSHGERRSLEFYTRGGEAIHKIYETEQTDRAAFAAILEGHRHASQGNPFEPFVADPKPATEKPDGEVDRDGLARGWEALTDTHQFFYLLRQVGATRTQALRLGSPRFAERVALGAWRTALERAAAEGLNVMVFVGSRGVMEIHTGPIHRVKVVGDWFNVLDPGFNLHLFEPGVTEAWVVRKPAEGVLVHSLELYDGDGSVVALFFVKRKEGKAAPEAWTRLLEQLPRVSLDVR